MATNGYDPKKAELFNKLRKSGLGDEQAWKQAGLTDADESYYVSNEADYNADGSRNLNKGQLGEFVIGGGSKPPVLSAEERAYRASIDAAGAGFDERLAADSARFEAEPPAPAPANVTKVEYPVTTKSSSNTKTVETYTNTSTEQVSGGGSTTTTAGAFKENATTRSLQPQIDAKQAELTQSYKDNPVSNRGREKAGLPLLSADELQANQQKALAISKEKVALEYKQQDAGTPSEPTVTTVPNTTTTESTTTYSKTVTNSGLSNTTEVQTPGGPDPVVEAQTETQIATSTVPASSIENAPAAATDPFSVTPRSLDGPSESSVLDDPNGVLAAEDAAIAEQEAIARSDADAFDENNRVQADPGGVLAAEDEAIRQEQIAADDAAAFPTASVLDDPNGVLAAEDAAIREDQIAAEDAALFNQRAAQDREEAAQAAQKQAALDQARAQNTIANQRKNANNADWRVKLRLAPQANYLYMAPNPGILAPLKAQGGVIFPYTPTISTGYKANYSSYDLTHSNYKGYYYQGSAVDPVSLSCPFTAQSTVEADYLLAVIHFFKSVTKMFYGQDAERGTPPPLVYLTGLGEYQFNEHPCVVQSFTYELPTDVDYIRARSPNINNSNMLNQRQANNARTPGTTWGGGILGPLLGGAIDRLANAGLPKGGMNLPPPPATFGLNSPTYVPTKINISISLLPVQSRLQQSQNFSLRQYANGDLLKGGFW